MGDGRWQNGNEHSNNISSNGEINMKNNEKMRK
jgi:hypothetical protein